ncbi:MAG: hypothetical protein AB7R40_24235 [Nitrospiraceae bacterium]
MTKRKVTRTKARVKRRPRRASAKPIADPGLAPYFARTKRLAEAQKLLAIAGDRSRSLDVRLSAFEEYSWRFDRTAMKRLLAMRQAMIEAGNAVHH